MNKRFNFKVKEPIIKKYNGIIMFPTMHDITLSNFDKVADTIEKLLEFDNNILIVSKMDWIIANKFFQRFNTNSKKENLEFRITMTSDSVYIQKYFEKFAPSREYRINSMRLLANGFNCSVSVEPMLDKRILEQLVKHASPLTIWIGCLTNYKLNPSIYEEKEVIELYKTLPEIYEEYKQYDFIKFKDSFFKAMDREIKRRKNGGSK